MPGQDHRGSPRGDKAQGSIRRLACQTHARPQGTLARVKTQKPRPPGPAPRFRACGETGWRKGTWVRSGGNAAATLQAEKAPKAESHERCRHERRPARLRREQAVERVTKPWGRNVAGAGTARGKWTAAACMC